MKDILKNKVYKNDLERIITNLDLSSLSNKTILITGGLGLICSSIVDILHESNRNIKILVADINKTFFSQRYDGYKDIKYIEYNALEPLNFSFKTDFIIHGAGISSPDLYVSKPVETMLSNYSGVLNLLEYSKQLNVKRLLYISSSEVYGNTTNSNAFTEGVFGSSDISNIRNSYCEAKRASEMLCLSFLKEYAVNTVIVRPGHIFGPTASPFDKRISSEFAFKAARGENLEMKSSGVQKRSYCYSLDCAAAILTVLIKGIAGEAYNIGHSEVTSIKEMAEVLADEGGVILKLAKPSEQELIRFNPMDNSSLNNEKIKSLGYKDTFSVEEGLRHTVRILKDLYY